MSQTYAAEIEGFRFAYQREAAKLERMKQKYEATGETQLHLLHFHIMESKASRARKIAYNLARYGLMDAAIQFNTSSLRTSISEYYEYLRVNEDASLNRDEFAAIMSAETSDMDLRGHSVLSLHSYGIIDLGSCEAKLIDQLR